MYGILPYICERLYGILPYNTGQMYGFLPYNTMSLYQITGYGDACLSTWLNTPPPIGMPARLTSRLEHESCRLSLEIEGDPADACR